MGLGQLMSLLELRRLRHTVQAMTLILECGYQQPIILHFQLVALRDSALMFLAKLGLAIPILNILS
ncbi:MAG: hypothetical protein EBR82_85615 [Caulobacteraceae bacterium]|nr:hypothetical protein [Caulobacteraceae bacterium]